MRNQTIRRAVARNVVWNSAAGRALEVAEIEALAESVALAMGQAYDDGFGAGAAAAMPEPPAVRCACASCSRGDGLCLSELVAGPRRGMLERLCRALVPSDEAMEAVDRADPRLAVDVVRVARPR